MTDFCRTCCAHHAPGRHLDLFRVYRTDWGDDLDDEDGGTQVRARNFEEAAERYASQAASEGDNPEMVVVVRQGDQLRRFSCEPEWVISVREAD